MTTLSSLLVPIVLSAVIVFVASSIIHMALPLWQLSIWYRRDWMTTIKSTIDGLIYGLLTGGTFGWLWPH